MKSFFLIALLTLPVLLSFSQPAPESEDFRSPTIQIGVVVSDLEESLDFYKNVIGMTQTGAFTVSGEKAKNLGLSDGRELDVTILKLEDSEQANEWKLMSFGKDANHPKQDYVHDDTGVQYITIFVNHLDKFIGRMKKHNVKILSSAPSDLGGGNFFILVQDPDGTFIELIGPK